MMNRFAYQTVTVYGRTFQIVPLTMQTATAWSYNPTHAVTWVVWAIPRSLATTGGIIVYFLFLQVLRCFSSLRSPPTLSRIPALQAGGLSHSEIRGSRDICSYPRLIAAYHVLHRLREPRHPPCALSYLSYRIRLSSHVRYILSACTLLFSLLFVTSCQRSSVKNTSTGVEVSGLTASILISTIVENNGFEPLTPCLQSRCSSQLS